MRISGGNRVSQIKRLSDRIFERILAEKNIDAFNGAQGRILYVLWQEDNISLRDIAERTGLAPTTLTSMIDRMESAGLVSRLPDKADRRRTFLVLTDMSKGLYKDYQDVSSKMSRIFYEGFSEAEIAQCEGLLERIYNNLKQYD